MRGLGCVVSCILILCIILYMFDFLMPGVAVAVLITGPGHFLVRSMRYVVLGFRILCVNDAAAQWGYVGGSEGRAICT